MTSYRLVMPEDMNHYGFLFGGKLLMWIDEIAWMAVSGDYPGMQFVTVGMSEVTFKKSVHPRSVLRFDAQRVHVGTTSVTYHTDVYRRSIDAADEEHVFHTDITFVRVDEQGAKRRIEAASRAIVSLGSNIEPRRETIGAALKLLGEFPGTHLVKASTIVETEPVDVPEKFKDLKFLNCVAVLETTLEPLDFSRRMHEIEDALGRVRTVRNGPRTIDIDLIDFGGLRIAEPDLTLPHPRAHTRTFVTGPLRELGISLNCDGSAGRKGLRADDAKA